MPTMDVSVPHQHQPDNKQQSQSSAPTSTAASQKQHFYHTEPPPYLVLDMKRINLARDYVDDYDCIYDLDLLSLITSPYNQINSHNQQYQQQQQQQQQQQAAQQHYNQQHHNQLDLAHHLDSNSRPASLSSSYLSDYMQLDMHHLLAHHHQQQQVSNNSPPLTQQQYLSIEDLQTARNSCSLCGCNWQQDHVSLDCSECGGYSLTRPCPECDGKCKTIWKRNIATTHDRHRAAWIGQCALNNKTQQDSKAASTKDLRMVLSARSDDDDDDDNHSHVTDYDDDEHNLGSRHLSNGLCPSPAASYDSEDYSSSPSLSPLPSPHQFRQQQPQSAQQEQLQQPANQAQPQQHLNPAENQQHRPATTTTSKVLVARISC